MGGGSGGRELWVVDDVQIKHWCLPTFDLTMAKLQQD